VRLQEGRRPAAVLSATRARFAHGWVIPDTGLSPLAFMLISKGVQRSMTSKAQFAFALEYVSDIETTKRFFTDVLGLEVDRGAATFVQFKAGNGASYAIASDEAMDANTERLPELWWIVDDADAAFREMSSKAEVSMPLRQMPFGTCFGIKDPAGQVHYLLQFAPQRPSQPVG
jgi:predicted enzyme related to lactoylglutathione lyase